jgi:4-hydroxyphenylacetate 3-monooxygenase/4-hydroxybutyryl-CoA dehydratase/vinylacetyl-CoA-Delta-isomerase
MGNDSLTALSAVTYLMDEKLGTEYHRRFLKYFEYFQKNDLVGSAAMTDVKGDRSLRPGQQADPDLYLRVIEKNDQGIIVRGAKAHNTISPYSDELIILPTRAFTKDEAEYAVSFAIPADAEGILLVCRAVFNREKKRFRMPVDQFGETGSITIFDDVLVPWERVFMCGEWQFAGALTSAFSRCHRHTYCGCKPATTDILLGAAALIAEYNGVEKASHIGGKLAELIATSELIFACGISSSMKGEKTPSGTFLPDRIFSNVGRFHAGKQFHHECEIIHDIAGGLATTMPEDEDLLDPEIWTFMEKYLKGKADVPAEYRIRCLRLIEDLTVSHLGGHKLVGGIHGGGSPEMEKIAIIQEYNLEEKKDIVKDLAGIPKDKK